MSETSQLLADYADNGSETAFRELVSRYIGLVYSSALRMAGGDAHLAEDICQTVFINLARNARKLSRDSTLGGWLHRDTCFVAGKVLRTERRRAAREREAVLMNSTPDHSDANLRAVAPVLDEAINNLEPEDRTAILLRFFEQHDFRTIGVTLGSNEDAARMRVNRALQKLHLMLKRQGVTMSAAALGTALTAEATSAAPAALAIKISTAAISASVPAAATTTAIKIMAITKTHAAIAGAVAALAIATPLFLMREANLKTDSATRLALLENQSASLSVDNAALSNSLSAANAAIAKQSRDLARLQSTTQVKAPAPARRASAVRRTSAPTQTIEPAKDENQQPYWASRGHDGRNIGTVLLMYSNDHNGKLPVTIDELGKYLEQYPISGTNQFDIVFHGSFNDIQNRSETILLRESQPQRAPDGKWAKVYGFADGHSELHTEADGNFAKYEQEHGIAPQ